MSFLRTLPIVVVVVVVVRAVGHWLSCVGPSTADDESEVETPAALEPSADGYRAQATLCAQRRKELLSRSQEARRAGNKAEAESLSNAAEEQWKLMAEANAKAADAHYNMNNSNRDLGELDLHGLFVKEAIEKVEQRIALCKKMRRKDLVVIVGKGKHSKGGIAVLKPRVEKVLREHGLSITVGRPNAGCIYVEFDNRGCFRRLTDTCAIM